MYSMQMGPKSCTGSMQCVVNVEGSEGGGRGRVKGELTTQQKQKKYASHGSCKRSSPEVVVLDEYHVDGYVCCRCGECHDGGAPNMVLDLHGLQCQLTSQLQLSIDLQVMTCSCCAWRNINISNVVVLYHKLYHEH